MARLLGIGLLLVAAFSSIFYAITHIAPSAVVLAYADDASGGASPVGPTPLEALSQAGLEAEAIVPVGVGHPAGIYAVGPSPDKRRAVRDRDLEPNTPPYGRLPPVEGNLAPVTLATPQGEISPGLYATDFEAEGCGYELRRVMIDREVDVIGAEYLAAGRVLVSINDVEPDWFSSSVRCGQWYEWSPLPVALSQAGNGDYWVGDLARGVWVVPTGCRWETVVGFRGGSVDDVVSFGAGPEPLVIDEDTYGVRIRNCTNPLTLDVQATVAAGAETPTAEDPIS